jgi:hypothetical protein
MSVLSAEAGVFSASRSADIQFKIILISLDKGEGKAFPVLKQVPRHEDLLGE